VLEASPAKPAPPGGKPRGAEAPGGWNDPAVTETVTPTLDQVLAFCADEPVERVFLEDIARRGLGRFSAVVGPDPRIEALCHVGANVVPSGSGCAVFAEAAVRSGARMVIGEEQAVGELWEAARRRMPRPRDDRPGQPVYALRDAPEPGATSLRPARPFDLDLLVPACAAAHREEIGVDPLKRDAKGFRWRTRQQIEEGRSWIWVEEGVIRFKAEASAWTPAAVQLQQVWVDPQARRRGYARRGLCDLCRLLLERVPAVCLFVRPENAPALALYDSIGMTRELMYRSLVF
jgi:GNAT superfamily N-acetyltransferase